KMIRKLVFATTLALLCPFTTPSIGADSPGISKEKPAKGPSVKVEDGYMVPYTITVPGSDVTIDMVPVPGGTFNLGSPEDEDGFEDDQGPQIQVKVEPMWVAKYETTWKQYQLYMAMYQLFKDPDLRSARPLTDENAVDAVTAPTELYEPSFTFEFGQDDELPAVTMTQYAAKQYTKWLSKLTGQQYRLPAEAEWEYACRAGSEDAFSFGEDEDELEEYAWYYDNADDLPHPVGEKKPNAFGLHDMHGNVMEWAIDGYTDDGYASLSEKEQPLAALDTIRWAESYDNRVVRGGSFQDDPEQLRAAAKLTSDDDNWREDDPNSPLSPWWYTSDPTRGIGFRIFRSYKPIEKQMIAKFWEIDNEDIEFDVDFRLTGGRGAKAVVDPSLAEEIKKLNEQ
ncbi:MAG TPA: transcriptional regulator, partial [Planctomycetaceae bacterium]|nr:transcriptional regulator [Planctomycetaceae bacterium]